MKIFKYIMIWVILASLLITGCSQIEEPSHQESGAAANGSDPVLEYAIGSKDWSVITSLTDNAAILEAYQFAIEHPEVLNYMPCYCGCYEEAGHIHNTHCFVKSVDDGVATLDTMGFG